MTRRTKFEVLLAVRRVAQRAAEMAFAVAAHGRARQTDIAQRIDAAIEASAPALGSCSGCTLSARIELLGRLADAKRAAADHIEIASAEVSRAAAARAQARRVADMVADRQRSARRALRETQARAWAVPPRAGS